MFSDITECLFYYFIYISYNKTFDLGSCCSVFSFLCCVLCNGVCVFVCFDVSHWLRCQFNLDIPPVSFVSLLLISEKSHNKRFSNIWNSKMRSSATDIFQNFQNMRHLLNRYEVSGSSSVWNKMLYTKS